MKRDLLKIRDLWRNRKSVIRSLAQQFDRNELFPSVAVQTQDDKPLRLELFNADQLKRHATTLAGSHTLRTKHQSDRLLARLNANEIVLLHAYSVLTDTVKAKQQISPAGEWILDNFHFIEEQIRLAKRHLPKGYSLRLPQLSGGPSDGTPRVYDLALEIIAHVDGRIDKENTSRFVSTYQEISPLTLGELWAVPIMLRLALIENLRRVAVRVVVGIGDRSTARFWSQSIRNSVLKDPKNLILVVADMSRSNPPLSNSFVAEFSQRLQEHGSSIDIPLAWIEHQLAEEGSSIDLKVQTESQQQAANQVSVGASIGSLRFLNAIDWRDFVQENSVVEKELLQDPIGVYQKMDFFTRDRYRHVVEDLARKHRISEPEVARSAIELAKQEQTTGTQSERKAHVGYYLVDDGLSDLLLSLRVECSWIGDGRVFFKSVYFLTVLLVTVAVAEIFIDQLLAIKMFKWTAIGAAYLCASQVGVAIANWLASIYSKPNLLPRIDFSKGVSDHCRTLVVVPTLLFDLEGVDKLIEGLEIRFFGNKDQNIYFGLLTDFADAPTETTSSDESILGKLKSGIAGLNASHCVNDTMKERFFLFHRPREWNPAENTWMGYERKRGKLEALNNLLRGKPFREGTLDPAFSAIVGDFEALGSVKYVITLDTDTQLPRGAAAKLIGTMAHPLNVPYFDEQMGRVSKGYGILQPRVAVHLPTTNKSWFVRLYGGDGGTDPYTRAVSDVYQDVFSEGSFIGKGIYDVDAFTQALETALPSNLILSHDLIEGDFARSGLVSDVVVYEDHPSHYVEDLKRRRRWIRGDWQILYWLLPWVPQKDRRWRRNSLSLLSRWKIFDNIRRSLVPISTIAVLLVAWAQVAEPSFISRLVVGAYFLSAFFSAFFGILNKPAYSRLLAHFSWELASGFKLFIQALLTLVFLPIDAMSSAKSILTSLWRMFVSHERLLEWRSASDPGSVVGWSVVHFYKSMAAGPLSAMLGGFILLVNHPANASPAALSLLCLWFFSPLVAFFLSQDLLQKDEVLESKQISYLRRLSRKNWRFFEVFVNADDNWLPPDNFQEFPQPVVAHRTSPTNIGMALLANLAAYDFGYIWSSSLLKRTEETFTSLDKMERFRGHFYNWYDTQSLKPLLPKYVSTVDSGNFASHLLVLETGLRELPDALIIRPQVWSGLRDTIDVIRSLIDEINSGKGHQKGTPSILTCLDKISQNIDQAPVTLIWIQALSLQLRDASNQLCLASNEGDESIVSWIKSLNEQLEQNLFAPFEIFALWGEAFAQVSSVDDEISIDLSILNAVPSLRSISSLPSLLNHRLDSWRIKKPELASTISILKAKLESSKDAADLEISRIVKAADKCQDLANFEYGFLYDSTRNLLSIGYNVVDHRMDAGFYDLLASEARLISFVGIAQGKLPQDHWFALGRLLTSWRGESMLLSWSGSMFEYLMPLLVMPTFEGTLLDQTYRKVVQRHIEYGVRSGVPWGVSESGYNTTDLQLNYQYRAFGVPGLGFKRGLADDVVVAPYASMMALMVNPKAACQNLERLRKLGIEGRYGFYEAVDYTPSRLTEDQSFAIVRSFMAHHQGMGFLSLAYLLLDQPMQKRFRNTPIFKATELLLHERVPKIAAFYPHAREVSEGPQLGKERDESIRVIDTPFTLRPETHLLSNGRYSLMLTNSGGGYSRWNDFALTRWREDPTLDDWGTFCYVRDVESSEFWSTTYQPTLKEAEHYEAIFLPSRAEFRCRSDELELHTEITVSPEDDIELRRITITNLSTRKRVIELTSYAEVVLAPQAADEAHKVFSNLFIQTELIPSKRAILCSRRPRSDHEKSPILLHQMTVHGQIIGEVSYETDRRKFIGRGRSVSKPVAMHSDPNGAAKDQNLTGSSGSVLDPIVAIRCRVEIGPEQTITAHMVSGVGSSRMEVLHLAEKYFDKHICDRVFELAWTHRQVVARQLDIRESDAQIYSKFASFMLYASPFMRAAAPILLSNRRGQSSLWGYGISGDLPILLVKVGATDHIDIVLQAVRAHSYWRMMGLRTDLVILNEDPSGYRQDLNDRMISVVASCNASELLDERGGIYIRRTDQMAEDDAILLQTIARAILTGTGGSLRDQVERRPRPQVLPAALVTQQAPVEQVVDLILDSSKLEGEAKASAPSLLFANGFGGFSADGREYIIESSRDHATPAPWANVIANQYFGTVVSESGGSYTWCENAHEYRLTPWYNDPLSDTSGEAFYIRDEKSGDFWSPTPLPAKSDTPYTSAHGFGYSVFKNSSHEIKSSMTTFVAMDAPVKFVVIKLTNSSSRRRKLSVSGFCEWVLGELRTASLLHITTDVDPVCGALLARNPYHPEFGNRIGFFNTSEKQRSFTCDRSEFLGRNLNRSSPAAMGREILSNRIGAAMDPCAAMQGIMDLAPGEEKEITFVYGVGRDIGDVRTLVQRFCGNDQARDALAIVREHWERTLTTVQIKTPEPKIDVMINGWLPYQVIASRIWGRSGYYQSGGAFGFRDQLQDAMALMAVQPAMLRQQIIRCAGRQFREGDVQHWWHPPSGRGVRTHFSDDYLWLPFAASRYVLGSRDTGLLDERVHFLEGRHVKPDEEAYLDNPDISGESATVYEHCVRAIRYGLKFGKHGLPLMGCGDWNDGMNLVGERGQGESVWLAFFLYDVLQQFSKVAELHGDADFAEVCRNENLRLKDAIETEGWDGEWYRRAYFDGGEPLGSHLNSECQIDSLPQSWAVLSGAGSEDRQRRGMAAAEHRLVDRANSMIKLFDPPFDKSQPNPGYIKGYVPGVRENGGQYTHAAIWMAMAFAELGETEKAWDLTRMISPITHSSTNEDALKYRAEPYVLAADVYAVAPHVGQGGWTWYTGSAGWMYQLILESLIGFSLRANKISFDLKIPSDWNEFQLDYRYRNTSYKFQFSRKASAGQGSTSPGQMQIKLDGEHVDGSEVSLVDDLVDHAVEILF